MLKFANMDRGFTLVELLMVIVILAILMALALPSMSSWLANARVKAKADSTLNGLQLARTEAIKNNTRVEFRFGSNTSWLVCLVSNNCATALHSAQSSESGTSVATIITPTNATKVTFSGIGMTTANADGTAMINTIEFNDPGASSNDIWQVRIAAGGMARVCNPSIVDANDPNKC